MNAIRGVQRGLFVFLSAWLAPAAPAQGQVVINEVVAATSDRQLRRAQPGYPRLGITTPWYDPAFDDSRWSTGNGPFGFGTFSGVTYGVNTSALMQNKVPSLYVRKSFTASAAQAASAEPLRFTVRYNDGFIAFLNGEEVARRNMGNPGMFAYRDQVAFNPNTNDVAETITLGLASNLLAAGANHLCIQTHNKAVTGTYANNLLCRADLHLGTAGGVSLVTNNTAWKYFVGTVEPSGGVIDYGLLNGLPLTATWATLGFNDSSWPESPGPFGFDRGNPPAYTLGTNLVNELYNKAVSIYSRVLFAATPAEAASAEPLRLVIDWDDGVIVYVNGREVARRNVGTANTVTPYDALATAHNANGDGGATGREEVLTLGPANTLLAPGYNVLAVQNHNSSKTSSDMVANVTLSTTGPASRTLARPNDAGRFFIGTREPFLEDAEEDADMDEDTPDSEGDWIELRNLGAEAVSLTGWSLTDDEDEPRKWTFPANSSIAAAGYLLVMATGYNVGPANGATYLHSNFRLGKEGEYLGLVDASGQVVSQIAPAFPRQTAFHSYVRTGPGAYAYSDAATPGAANAGATFSAITAPPVFSHLGGFFASGFTLQLSSPDPDAAIRYTLDGREPTETTGAAYGAPLSITANTALRARCFKPGQIPSDTVTHTYLIAQSAARRSLSALVFTGDPALALYGPNAGGGPAAGEGVMAIKGGGYVSDLWDPLGNTSAFNFPMLRGRCSEKPVAFEFYPTNGVPLRTGLGLRISGSNHARPRYRLTAAPSDRFPPTTWTSKPSFNIFFRGELGESPQDYPFFADSKVTKFEDIRIRAGKNDASNPFIRDEFVRRTFIGTGQEGSRGIFASVYINGVWKGYYNFCEHLREAFMQQHHNSTAAWDVRQVGEFASGDALHWNDMMKVLRTNDLSQAAAYQGVHGFLDVDNTIDYLLVNAFAAMWDWPNNNWVGARERSAAGRWRFYVWDAEGCFGMDSRTTSYNTFTSDLTITDAQTTTSKWIPAIYTLLKVSPEFRLRFADRAQKHLFNNGCLTQESMSRLFYALRDQINPIMKEAINATVNETFHNTWIVNPVRRDTFFTQLTAQGLWPATLAPTFSQHGGEITTNTWVSIANPNSAGSIYWTTNGVDPRGIGGAVAGAVYAAPLRFPATTTLKARVLGAGGAWSPLQEATFTLPRLVPFFLPGVNADWTTAANWSTFPQPYPDGSGAAAMIDAPPTGNREVNLRAPVTVGDLIFNQGDSPYRNKISDSGSTSTLTFQSTNAAARLTVNGSGPGYVEFEVDSDVVLASDLTITVNNPAGSAEYGALRIRAEWRGSGGITKDGPGRATFTGDGKIYTGPTVIDQGVLQLTGPASPARSAAVAVNPGGQLRMSSASTAGEPRVYDFGGDLTLNSLGRGGDLPAMPNLGVSGALRYEPESNDSTALITNRVVFAGPSALHVENARNSLLLAGPLLGNHGFTKTGGGDLILFAHSPAYYVPVRVGEGTLTVHGRLISPVEVAAGARLSGTGKVGPIRGDGAVALDKTLLTSPAAIGLNYAFVFSAAAPSYRQTTASGNSVLRLLSIRPGGAAPVIEIYLDVPALTVGDTLRGGFFVECGDDLHGFLANADVRFYEPSAGGDRVFAGRLYAPYGGGLALAVAAVPEEADFGDGPRQGLTMEIRASGQPVNPDETDYPGEPPASKATVLFLR